MAELIDGYSVNNDNARKVYVGSYVKLSQSWTGAAKTLYSVKLKLQKFGSPPGSGTINIYAHSGTYGTSSVPTGAALATTSVDFSGITAGSYNWYEFLFAGANQITLSAQYYTLSYEYAAGDVNNCLAVADKETSPAHGGNCAFYFSSWAAQSGKDLVFEVYGLTAATGAIQRIQSYYSQIRRAS